MATVLEVLREIYQTRIELTDLREKIKRAPLQLKAKENDVEKIRSRIVIEKDEAKKVRVEADSRELTLKQAESRIRDLKGKLNVAESNKEYQVIQDEIKRIAADNDKLQDEILEKITIEEDLRSKVKKSEGELADAEKDFAKYKEVVDYQIEKLKVQVGILADQLKKLEPQLGDSLGDYQRMMAAKGDQGIAECVSGTCQGCFSEQPPQSWQELLNGRPFKCRTCGALMFKSS
jgi:predicted  nucleic acid-binding Zn-ribbon protein